jgi:hypothetical protein
MARGNRPVAFFAMSTHRGVPLQQVHEMLREIVRRVGRTNCGEIAASPPCEHGNYAVTFTNGGAADAFERLYRSTGHVPQRTATVPPGMQVVEIEVVAGVVMSLADFMRSMNAHLN